MKKEKEQQPMEEVNPIEQILDENNTDNIVLYNEKNEPFEFEQIAVIALGDDDNQKLYPILLPVSKIQGIGEDEAVTFELDEENGTIKVCEDEATIDKVFAEYERLLKESEQ